MNNGGTLAAASGSSIELGGLLVNNGTQTGTLNINLGAIVEGSGTFGSVHVTAAGTFGATGTITGGLVVDSGASVTLSGDGLLTVNGGVTNDGIMRFERGAQLAVDNSMFVNRGTLDIIAGGFSFPPGFVNNGIVLDSSVVKIKEIAVQPGGPVTVSIDGCPGHIYQLERSDSLEEGSFQAVPDVATQTNAASNTAAVLLAFTDPNPAAGKGFYRVAVDP